MSNGVLKLELFVDDSDVCVQILKYVDNCVLELNKTGAKVRVTKFEADDFDEETVALMRNNGITRLPAIMGAAKTPLVGVSQICGFLDGRIKSDGRRKTIGGGAFGNGNVASELGSNADLSEFWAQEMYAGFDERRRKFVPRKDDDEDDDERAKDDIDRRIREYNRNVPRHRRMESGRGNRNQFDDDDDEPPPPRARNGRNARPAARRAPPIDDDYDGDNIADSDPEYDDEPVRGRSNFSKANVANMSEGDMDAQMMSAWMDNNPGSADY